MHNPRPAHILHRKRYLVLLGALFAVVWAALAIAPHDRSDWVLENALSVLFIVALLALRQRLPLSTLSYTLIFAFLCLHTIGAHYTYSLVPYETWLNQITGTTLHEWYGFERNHFDRLVHFCYGLLLAYPLREVLLQLIPLRGFWGYFFPFDLILSTSLAYELIEWRAAILFGGELGVAYLGTQGDVWDAHKDMTLAGAGALLALLLAALYERNRSA